MVAAPAPVAHLLIRFVRFLLLLSCRVNRASMLTPGSELAVAEQIIASTRSAIDAHERAAVKHEMGGSAHARGHAPVAPEGQTDRVRERRRQRAVDVATRERDAAVAHLQVRETTRSQFSKRRSQQYACATGHATRGCADRHGVGGCRRRQKCGARCQK